MQDPVTETAHYVATVSEDGAVILVQHGRAEQPGCVRVTRRERPGARGRSRLRARHLLRALELLLIG